MQFLLILISIVASAVLGVLLDWLLKPALPNDPKRRQIVVVAMFTVLVAVLAALFEFISSAPVDHSSSASTSPPPKTETAFPPSTPKPEPTERVKKTGPIAIGIIDAGSAQDIYDCLVNLGYDVEYLPPDAGREDFIKYDIIYLPSTWAQMSNYKIDAQSEAYLSFVYTGGGLMIEQPNPYQSAPGNSITPKILPYPVIFGAVDVDNGFPIVVENDHYLTNGLSNYDLPRGLDAILAIDPHYKVLAVSPINNFPTLAILEYESGRIVITAGTANPVTGYRFSDEFLNRALNWVSFRDGVP